MSEAAEAVIDDGDDGIGANKRRKKPPTKVKPVKVVPAKEAVPKSQLGQDNDHVGANGTEATKTFDLEYKDQRGYEWTGKFKTHILTIGERTSVGLTRSRMAGGINLQGIDEGTLSLMEMQAHLALCIDQAPKWADDLSTVRDIGVLAAIYKEVAEHEATFWSPDPEAVLQGPMEG